MLVLCVLWDVTFDLSSKTSSSGRVNHDFCLICIIRNELETTIKKIKKHNIVGTSAILIPMVEIIGDLVKGTLINTKSARLLLKPEAKSGSKTF